MKLDLQITSEKWKCSVSRLLTVSKLLFPSMLWPPRGWLAWFLLIGVGGPRDALSFRGAEIAAKTTTSDKTFEWVEEASISKKTNWRDCLALSNQYRRTTEIRLAGTQHILYLIKYMYRCTKKPLGKCGVICSHPSPSLWWPVTVGAPLCF